MVTIGIKINQLRITPLKIRGVLSYLQTRRPTDEELKRCEHFELTSPESWGPYDLNLNQDDESCTSPFGRTRNRITEAIEN